MSKQLTTLPRHGTLPREDDGAIEFWRLTDDLRSKFVHSQHWSDEKVEEYNGKKAEETRKYFNILLIHQDKKFFISEPFKVIQDAIS